MTLETVRCFGTEQRKAPRPSPERHERHAEASLRHAPQVSVSAVEGLPRVRFLSRAGPGRDEPSHKHEVYQGKEFQYSNGQ